MVVIGGTSHHAKARRPAWSERWACRPAPRWSLRVGVHRWLTSFDHVDQQIRVASVHLGFPLLIRLLPECCHDVVTTRARNGGIQRNALRRFPQVDAISGSFCYTTERPPADWGSSGRSFKSCQPDRCTLHLPLHESAGRGAITTLRRGKLTEWCRLAASFRSFSSLAHVSSFPSRCRSGRTGQRKSQSPRIPLATVEWRRDEYPVWFVMSRKRPRMQIDDWERFRGCLRLCPLFAHNLGDSRGNCRYLQIWVFAALRCFPEGDQVAE